MCIVLCYLTPACRQAYVPAQACSAVAYHEPVSCSPVFLATGCGVGVAFSSGQVGELLGLWREEFPKGMPADEYARKRNQLRALHVDGPCLFVG